MQGWISLQHTLTLEFEWIFTLLSDLVEKLQADIRSSVLEARAPYKFWDWGLCRAMFG
jgi:hypothetical protein